MRNGVIREVLHQKETLVDKIKKKRLTWFGHVTRMDERQLPPRAMHGHIEGTRNVGRQPQRWIDHIKDDIADLGLNIRTATDSARDRRKWRHLVTLIVNQRLTEERRRRRKRRRKKEKKHGE